ncbi:unnamed protein product [Amoebophrya sp. A25]|nr:unnamed protein product [Amoebophrya sp. A25]|eukprot:GSA25T00020861001.1
MVPQSPFLMHGTVRENLDPFNEYSSAEIVKAFEAVFGTSQTRSRQTTRDEVVSGKGASKDGNAGEAREWPTPQNLAVVDDSQVVLQIDQHQADRTTTPISKRQLVPTRIVEQTEEPQQELPVPSLHDSDASESEDLQRNTSQCQKSSGQTQTSLSRLSLETKVEAHGANLSAGEGQLLAFARMALRKNEAQIILLDEPSSNLDAATDRRITQILHTILKDRTVFLIAHRLKTLMDCDKILVMDAGRVEEFASPAELLKNPDSFFTRNMASVGVERGVTDVSGVAGSRDGGDRNVEGDRDEDAEKKKEE